MTAADLAAYQAQWLEPISTTYRGLNVYANSGRGFGGLWSLVALRVLEFWKPQLDRHYTNSAEDLEVLVRTVREVDPLVRGFDF